MIHSISVKSKFSLAVMLTALCMFPFSQTAHAQSDVATPVFSPVVNGQALRGLSTISSAESMGEGRITFGFILPWYEQQKGYLTSPNESANIFTGTGAFSYGVNSYVDLFASVSGFTSSKYTNTDKRYGLGTITAGAQGSLPFPQSAFLRMGGQAAIIGGTSQNQINTFRSDGYNYLETRTGYDFMGKLLQTIQSGTEDWGVKAHLNEGGVFNINKSDPALLLLGAGVQGNMGPVVLSGEINSRTRFNDMAFSTDPMWVTPSVHFRTPYQMNAMAGVDIALCADRSNNLPRALEPYRVFGSLAFSFDMLEGKRHEAFLQKQKEAQEKADLENKVVKSDKQVSSLKNKNANDSAAYAQDRANNAMQIGAMQTDADALAKKATADSLSLIQANKNLAEEKEKRSDAEKKLLSTGELLLDAVYFETDKTIISINSKPYLNIIGKMLAKYPKLQIEVQGHTDNVGGQEYNVTLSQGRADAVRSYLVDVSPMLSSTLSAHGYGMSMAKADNATKEGRSINRRVELRVTNKDALLEYSKP